MKCATRGCAEESAGARFTKCARCLLGLKRVEKFQAQIATVAALPPLVVPAGAWGFRVPGVPVSWNNALVRPKHGRPFLSDKAREWKQAIAAEALRARPAGWPLGARYALHLHSVFARSTADVDGPLKLVQDALSGVAWADDRQVVAASATKDVDPQAPRIEVVVRSAGGMAA
jgi:Holliday junction resolvase RusA-like endonuclease